MPHLPFQSGRFPAAASVLCAALAVLVAGCATKKNPLMEEPTPVAASQPAAAADGDKAKSDAKAATAGGVQTVKEKRFLGFLRPYRPDIQQGNFVSQEMVAQLKPGMTQDQVVFLLGTPLLTDVFHADRWDYAFRLQKGNGEVTTSHVTVHFKDGVVSSFEGGDDLPTEQDYLDRIADKAKKK
ncbi:hypothetical protein GCM10007205_17360 [Oxalicibacterium flavum]|uniref:Outer membrane protein assembly factor BamE n=1 Tax=Oxalicibacterium flavum TaxID=179467 RepID=A0A8J2UKW7_9BURK|nr:outer membrane protein assembly factor BamE [Oxalicibacterium flavum]GGC08759.1 hypothetical protein GCM10007205_17360 [Oxalicibacterium flavum]